MDTCRRFGCKGCYDVWVVGKTEVGGVVGVVGRVEFTRSESLDTFTINTEKNLQRRARKSGAGGWTIARLDQFTMGNIPHNFLVTG